MPNSTRNSFSFDYSGGDSECCVSSSHHWVLKGTWVIMAYLYEWAKWDGSCKQAHVLLFLLLLFFQILLWCHNQRLPEHKVHSQTPVHNTGAELQTSRLHGNCSRRAWMVPLLLSFSGGIWSCVFVCVCVCFQGHVRLFKQPVALMGKVLIFILYNYKQKGCWAVIPGWIQRFFSYYRQQMEERTESCRNNMNLRTN